MSKTWIVRLALGLAAATTMAGCGHAAPAAQPMTIDSVFTRTPASDASQQLVQQQQQRQDDNAGQANTHDVGGTDSDKKSGG